MIKILCVILNDLKCILKFEKYIYKVSKDDGYIIYIICGILKYKYIELILMVNFVNVLKYMCLK